MSDQEDWGPWIEHDGKGCPCVGEWIHVVSFKGDEAEGIAKPSCNNPVAWRRSRWFWRDYDDGMRIDGAKKYRIRRPKGISILTAILREVERDGGKGHKVSKRMPSISEQEVA